MYSGYCVEGPLAGQQVISRTPFHKAVVWHDLDVWAAPKEQATAETVDIITYRHLKDETGEWWVL